jgi:hypothetical protein
MMAPEQSLRMPDGGIYCAGMFCRTKGFAIHSGLRFISANVPPRGIPEWTLIYTRPPIRSFESPFGMELLATVDWLLSQEEVSPTVPALREALKHWDGGAGAAARKSRLFDDTALDIALKRLTSSSFKPEMAA